MIRYAELLVKQQPLKQIQEQIINIIGRENSQIYQHGYPTYIPQGVILIVEQELLLKLQDNYEIWHFMMKISTETEEIVLMTLAKTNPEDPDSIVYELKMVI